MAHVGTGRNLVDARKPAVLQAGGVKVAALADAWSSRAVTRRWKTGRVLPRFVPSTIAPRPASRTARVTGYPPVCTTVPLQEDMDNLRADIAAAKEAADIVVVQFHGGDDKRPFFLSDHELRSARFAVDCGANVVVGHHHHVLRGMEWYKGVVIFDGLGHFVFDLKNFRGPKEMVTAGAAELYLETDESYALAPRKGWPLLPLASRRSHDRGRLGLARRETAGRCGLCPVHVESSRSGLSGRRQLCRGSPGNGLRRQGHHGDGAERKLHHRREHAPLGGLCDGAHDRSPVMNCA